MRQKVKFLRSHPKGCFCCPWPKYQHYFRNENFMYWRGRKSCSFFKKKPIHVWVWDKTKCDHSCNLNVHVCFVEEGSKFSFSKKMLKVEPNTPICLTSRWLLQFQRSSSWTGQDNTHTHKHTQTHTDTQTHTNTHTHTHTHTCTCTTAWYKPHDQLFFSKAGEARQNDPTENSTGCGVASWSSPVRPGTCGRKKYSTIHGFNIPQWVGRMRCSLEWWHHAPVQDSRLHYSHPLWDDTR